MSRYSLVPSLLVVSPGPAKFPLIPRKGRVTSDYGGTVSDPEEFLKGMAGQDLYSTTDVTPIIAALSQAISGIGDWDSGERVGSNYSLLWMLSVAASV